MNYASNNSLLVSLIFVVLLSFQHGSQCLDQQPTVLQNQQTDANLSFNTFTKVNIAPPTISTTTATKPLMQAALANAPIRPVGNLPQPTAHLPVVNDSPILSNQKVPQIAPSLVPSEQPQLSSYLYGNEDPVVHLDYSTINDEVLRKSTANFVYFNANFNYCRHCHMFLDIWRELALDIRYWRRIIKLFTINCSDEDNIDTCRRAGVTQFPQVKYYWIMSSSLDQDGQRIRILGKSTHAMRHLIMDKVLDSYNEHIKNLAQRHKSTIQLPSVVNSPFATEVSPNTPSGGSNQMASIFAPMMGQLLSSSNGGGSLGSLISAFSGKGGTGGANLPTSLTNLLGSLGGVQGVSRLMSAANSMRPKSIQPLPNNWPELDPIEISDSQQLIDLLPLDPAKSIGALLIMETQEFLYIGSEVLLDLNPYSNQTYIARVRDDRSQLLKNLTKLEDVQAPALVHVTPLREAKLILTAPKYTNDEDLRRAFVRAFDKRQTVKLPWKRTWSMPQSPNLLLKSSDGQEDDDVLNRANHVYMDDLTNTIRSSLMEQVYRHADLSDDQFNALVKYVYALINYFPFNSAEDDGLRFLKRLHTWLQNQVSPIDIGEYKKQFHDIDEVFPKREWVACKSLSNTKAIPSKSRKTVSLFENPAQIGKVVSNITRFFRGQQQQASKLKNLFNVFTNNMGPVMLNQNQGMKSGGGYQAANHSINVSRPQQQPAAKQSSQAQASEDSPIERIIKSLVSGSLGSDSSILKLISTALTGASGDSSGGSTSGKSKFAREYPCGAWKLAHVMVVNEYIKDSPRKDVKHIVMHSLYQYMLHFYACTTCGNRVNDVSSEFRLNLDEHLQDQVDSIMLLWKIHNRVNKRLEGELRPGSPIKQEFPSESLCPKCRIPRTQPDLMSTPRWQEKQVQYFLVHHYRKILPNANSSSNSIFAMSSATNLIAVDGFGQQLACCIVALVLKVWFISFQKLDIA